jgi:beta-phosphoglucomutase-like phosphatase (HAD superfamily)
MIQAVIFDIDGTLVDSVDLHARAWQEALQDFGREFPYEQVRHEIGKGGDRLLPGLLAPKAVEAQGEDIKAHRAELFKRKVLPDVRPFPGVRALFERIKTDGKKIALASSAMSDEIEVYKRIANIEGIVDASVHITGKRKKPLAGECPAGRPIRCCVIYSQSSSAASYTSGTSRARRISAVRS